MPEHCAAYSCANRRTVENRVRGITFHRFPKDKFMRKKWEVALRREGFTASETSVICSEHFKQGDLDRTGQVVRLRDGVVPSIFSLPVHLQRVGVSSQEAAADFKGKMPEASTFFTETKAIVETAIKTAVNMRGDLEEEEKIRADDSCFMGRMLAQEATRKINTIFLLLSSKLHDENKTLRDEVKQLESKVKTLTADYENAQTWRENVLSGCPVLFKQSGLIYTLKLYGRLQKKNELSDEVTELQDPSEMQSEQDVDERETTEGVNLEQISPAEERISNETAGDYSTANTEESPNTQQPKVKGKGTIFVCNVCNKSFSRQFHLMKHMNTHKEQRPFSCDQCHRKFRTAASYELHLLREEEKKYATFKCQLCEKTFRNKMYLKNHQLVHSDARPFICSTCGKGFKTKQNLQNHQVVHSVEKPHKCSECGESFRYAITLQCHKSTHTGEHPYKCAVCGKAFVKRRSLRIHQAVHRGKIFTCETCGAGFTLQHNLKRHIRIHTGEKPFRCKVCGKSFTQNNNLKVHMLLHGASKSFMCDFCGKTFLYNCQLQKHQKVAHDEKHRKVTGGQSGGRGNRRVIYRRDRTTVDVTPFSCKICRKSFDTASALKRHEVIHGGQNQYSCDTCGKSFFYKATYMYHQRVHSGDRPFSCDICGSRFIILQALKTHQLQHSGEKPHKCEQCGKAFRIHTNYLRHLKIHTGEKPYECEVCGVRFRQLGHVKYHMQVHTGERPYSCSLCGLAFSESRLLKKHKCSEKHKKTSGDTLSTS